MSKYNEVEAMKKAIMPYKYGTEDYLIEGLQKHGFTLPPVKCGEHIYVKGCYTEDILKLEVTSIVINQNDMWLKTDSGLMFSVAQQWNKTVFKFPDEAVLGRVIE